MASVNSPVTEDYQPFNRARDWVAVVVAVLARGIVGTLLGLLFWAAVPAVIGWVPTTVMTGSMMPKIVPGDVVVAMPVDKKDLRAGQVILFQNPDKPSEDRLHRLRKILDNGELRTRGDANPAADSTPANPDKVRGVALLRVPWAGLPILWISEHKFGYLILSTALFAGLLPLCNIDAYLRRGARVNRKTSRTSGAHSVESEVR